MPMTSVLAPHSNRLPVEGSFRMKSVLQAPTSRHSSVSSSKWRIIATLFGIVTEAPAYMVSLVTQPGGQHGLGTHHKTWDAVST